MTGHQFLKYPSDPWYATKNLEFLKRNQTKLVVWFYKYYPLSTGTIVHPPLVCKIFNYQSYNNTHHRNYGLASSISVNDCVTNMVDEILWTPDSKIELYDQWLLTNIEEL